MAIHAQYIVFQLIVYKFIILLIILILPAMLHANPSAVYGVSKRPFPLIMSLDYPLARAKAWLNALEKTREYSIFDVDLPVNKWQLHDAIAALVYPVETITPEDSLDNEIRVYIDTSGDFTQLDLQEIFFQIIFQLETGKLVKELEASWPTSVSQIQHLEKLEKLSQQIKQLWELYHGRSEFFDDDIGDKEEILEQSVLFDLYYADWLLEHRFYQKALERALRIKNRAQKNVLTEPQNKIIWEFIEAYSEYLLGRLYNFQAQAGLAESAFANAILLIENNNLHSNNLKDNFISKLYENRGDIRQARKNISGMCEDYSRACVYGNCSKLIRARLLNNCTSF